MLSRAFRNPALACWAHVSGAGRRLSQAPLPPVQAIVAALSDARLTYSSVDDLAADTARAAAGESQSAIRKRRLFHAYDVLVLAIAQANKAKGKADFSKDDDAELMLARAALENVEADLRRMGYLT